MRALFLCLAASIAGCTSVKLMDGIMTSWVGASIDDVQRQWGYPDETRDFNGRKLYVWNHEKSGYIPGSTTASASTSGSTTTATATSRSGYAIHGSCTRILEVDDADQVIAWEWSGNNCPFAERFEYKNWRRRQ